MAASRVKVVGPGEWVVQRHPAPVLQVPDLATSVCLVLYDTSRQLGGLAHIILPDSSIDPMAEQSRLTLPAQYADHAIPSMMETFHQLGGTALETQVKLVGGAQLFLFGGAGGNFLNVGMRNAIAIRAALSKLGYGVTKADIGGNKARIITFDVRSGLLEVQPIGGETYCL